MISVRDYYERGVYEKSRVRVILSDEDFAAFVNIDTLLWVGNFHTHKIVVGVGVVGIDDLLLDA